MIAREKLERWTNSETADREEARDTQRAIRNELNDGALRGVSDGLEFTAYLQGSYRNTTMVYDSGDVDILVIRTDKYHGDFSEVNEVPDSVTPSRNPRQMFDQHAEGVYRTLQAQYGTKNVERDDKAIEVDSDRLPLNADVVPCLQYRKFWPRQSGNHMKGIAFWTQDGTKIVNYPRKHRIMGEQYNQRSNGNYKETIRVFKNFRNDLLANNTIKKSEAPSYFIECLLSNVEVSTIAEDDIRERVEDILQELKLAAQEDFPDYTTQHCMKLLFGKETTQWSIDDARTFIEAAHSLYLRD